MNKVLKSLRNILLVIWQLPQDLVGLVMYPFVGKKKLLRVSEYGTRVYEADNMQGAISLGNFIYLSNYSAKSEETIAHELGHTKQSRILGWLYVFVIGIPSICWASFKPREKCYYEFYTESWANKCAGLKVRYTKYGCRTYFPKDTGSHSSVTVSETPKKNIYNKVNDKENISNEQKIDINLSNKIDRLAKNIKPDIDLNKSLEKLIKKGAK